MDKLLFRQTLQTTEKLVDPSLIEQSNAKPFFISYTFYIAKTVIFLYKPLSLSNQLKAMT
jgi:hypothetical protein